MSAFLDPFRGEQTGWIAGRSVWTTLTSLRYESDYLVHGTIIVPREFISDLASVPRLPLVWLAVGGRGIRSAVIHDFAYQFGFWWMLEQGRWVRSDVVRQVVDYVFWESLVADPLSGAGRLRAAEMWAGVRAGGRGIWSDAARRGVLNPVWSEGPWEAP